MLRSSHSYICPRGELMSMQCGSSNLLFSWLYHHRCRPASSSRCLALGRNSKCLTKSFRLWSWTSLTWQRVNKLTNTHRLTCTVKMEDVKANTHWCVCVCVLGPQQCIFCGDLATFRCQGCFQDPAFNQCGFKVFCQTCSDKVCVVMCWLHSLHILCW